MEEVPDPSSLLYTHRVQEGEYEGIHYSGVTPVYNITAPTPNPSVQVQIPQEIPPIKMSKEELLALYEAALAKATQLQFTNHIEKPESEAIDSDSKNAPGKLL